MTDCPRNPKRSLQCFFFVVVVFFLLVLETGKWRGCPGAEAGGIVEVRDGWFVECELTLVFRPPSPTPPPHLEMS